MELKVLKHLFGFLPPQPFFEVLVHCEVVNDGHFLHGFPPRFTRAVHYRMIENS